MAGVRALVRLRTAVEFIALHLLTDTCVSTLSLTHSLTRSLTHSPRAGITNADEYLNCVAPWLKKGLGDFIGDNDRVLNTPDGGRIRFVRPKVGFNSHEWRHNRPAQKWHPAACW